MADKDLKDMTDIELVDRALYRYLSPLSDRIVYSTTSKAVQTIVKNAKYKDAIPYHFISFYRSPQFGIDMERQNFTAMTRGDMVRLQEYVNTSNREARYVQHLPVNLTYNIDIWSAKEANVQRAAISVISKLYMEQQIIIAEMNPEHEPARFHFTDITWMDNSDLEVENEKGKLYRHTITLTIPSVIKIINDIPTTKFCCPPIDIYENYNEGELI